MSASTKTLVAICLTVLSSERVVRLSVFLMLMMFLRLRAYFLNSQWNPFNEILIEIIPHLIIYTRDDFYKERIVYYIHTLEVISVKASARITAVITQPSNEFLKQSIHRAQS